MKIEVSEMYRGFQGEGPNLGRPSLFVRTRRCNLQCSWCDSKFTWSRDDPGFENYATFETPRHLVECMGTYTSPHMPQAVVLTGGEPLIWQRQLYEALSEYRRINPVPIEVETSGTVMPSDGMLRLCNFSISHKLGSSHKLALAGTINIYRKRLWRDDVVRRVVSAGALSLRNVCFKPVFAPIDYGEVEVYLQWLTNVCNLLGIGWSLLRERIYLMPEAATQGDLAAAQKYVMELAQAYGVRCTTRLHVLAYGNERRR